MDAWRSTDAVVRFAYRRRNIHDIERIALRYDVTINLGNSGYNVDLGVPLYNHGDLVRATSSPQQTRTLLDDFLPPYSCREDHWHKDPGHGGAGKFRHQDNACTIEHFEDVQQHIEGTEYRVISVSDAIVQAFKKVGRDARNRWTDFEWVGVDGISDLGIIPIIKEAVVCLPRWERSIVGWDVIRGEDRPYIIEANSSPGVNAATAQRIVNQIRRNHE